MTTYIEYAELFQNSCPEEFLNMLNDQLADEAEELREERLDETIREWEYELYCERNEELYAMDDGIRCYNYEDVFDCYYADNYHWL